MKTVTLYRPTGPRELELVKQNGYKKWPARLPQQPIFYPVLTEDYAVRIASEWNVKEDGCGFVTRFEVDAAYLDQFDVQTAGGNAYKEYWIPAAKLEEFNMHIVGKIEVIQSFFGDNVDV